MFLAGDNSRDHKEDHHQYAGDDTGNEQAAYRNFADKAVNYQSEGGWDGCGDHCGKAVDSDNVALGVASARHFRGKKSRLHSCVRGGRARNSAHHRTHNDGYLSGTAPHTAGNYLCKRKNSCGNARLVHQTAGKNEERNGEERIGLGLRNNTLHNNAERQVRRCREENHTGDTDNEGDRHSEYEQQNKSNNKQCHIVPSTSFDCSIGVVKCFICSTMSSATDMSIHADITGSATVTHE